MMLHIEYLRYYIKSELMATPTIRNESCGNEDVYTMLCRGERESGWDLASSVYSSKRDNYRSMSHLVQRDLHGGHTH